MSDRYHVQYSDNAMSGYNALATAKKREFDAEVKLLAWTPYSFGDSVRGDRDRRSASLAGVITEYEVSPGVLVITMLHLRGL